MVQHNTVILCVPVVHRTTQSAHIQQCEMSNNKVNTEYNGYMGRKTHCCVEKLMQKWSVL